MYKLDYHVHSNFSPDSKVDLEKLIINSINKNIKTLAVTDHLECDDNREYYSVEYFKNREKILNKLHEKYKSKIEILTGAELGQPQSNLERVDDVFKNLKLDYTLGAQHKGLNGEYLENIDFTINTHENVKYYFEEVYKITKIKDIDCLAHLDLVRRYASRMDVEIDIKKYRSDISDILKSVVENDKGIEINTSGIRQKIGDFMPNIETLKLYKKLGGTIVTVGSDAHISQNVGKDISRAINLLKEVGFKYVALFRKGKVEFEKIEYN